MKKRAFSEIIVVLLMTFFSIMAVLILWFSVKELMTERLKFSPEDCSDYASLLSIDRACFDEGTSELEITLTRNYGKAIDRFSFSIESTEESSDWNCGNSCGNCEPPGKTKKYYLPLGNKPEKASIKIGECVLDTKKVITC